VKRALKGSALACALLSILLLVGGFTLQREYIWLIPILIPILISLIGERFKWAAYPNLSLLIIFTILIPAMIRFPADGLYFGAGILAFSAWHLRRFSFILENTEHIHRESTIQQNQFSRFGILILLSVILGSLMLSIQLKIEFWAIVFLTILGFGTFSFALRYVKSRGF
jgi:hypothetical protein